MPKRNPDLGGAVRRVFVCPRNRSDSVAKESLSLTLSGIRGDRHSGLTKVAGVRELSFHEKGEKLQNHRQWSAVSAEELLEIAKLMRLREVFPEWLGANLIIGGCPEFSRLPTGTRLVFSGGVILMVYGENEPCGKPADVIHQALPEDEEGWRLFKLAAKFRRGLVGWVERGGIIQPKDTVEIYLPRRIPEL